MSSHRGCGCGGDHGEHAKHDSQKEKERAGKIGGGSAVSGTEQPEDTGNRSPTSEQGEAPSASERRGSCCR